MKQIAIIGAGVLGSAIGWRLARDGHDVTLFDPTPLGQASPGSLAWLNASFAQDPVYNRLRGDSLILWEGLARHDTPAPVHFPGAILWDQPHFDLDAIQDAQAALDRPVTMLDRAGQLAAEPNVPNPPDRALFCRRDGYGLPSEITRWFLDQARKAGARLVTQAVEKILTDDRRVTGISAGDQTWTGDAVIVAAGTALPDLIAPFGATVAMDNQPGLLVTTSPAPPLIRAMLATDGLHGWQGADGRFLIGADFGGGDSDFGDPDAHAAMLVDRLTALIPGAKGAGVERYTVRTRPMPADGRPAVGPMGPAGLYVVSTHSGMTLAPILADCVAGEVAEGTPDPRLQPFRPDRAALQPQVSAAVV